MDKSRKLMINLTASFVLLSPTNLHQSSYARALDEQSSPQTRVRKSKNAVPDEATVDAVLNQTECKPKSIDDFARELPKIKRKDIEDAIKILLDDDEIVRLGEGTTKNPYQYHTACGHTT